MENNNLSAESIRTITLRICNRYNYQQDMSDIIAGDLASGVSEDELSLYVGKKLSIRKVVVMSQCLRNKYSKDVIDIICDSSLSEYQMEVALKAYKSIGTVEGLKKALEETGCVPDRVKITVNKVDKKRSALPVKGDLIRSEEVVETETVAEEETKKATEDVAEPILKQEVKQSALSDADKEMFAAMMENLSKTQEKLLEQQKNNDELNKRLTETLSEAAKIKKEELAKKDQAEIQRLIDELASRESELAAKQDELNKAIAQTKSLNKELSSKDEEIERLRDGISELQKETRKKGDALEAANKAISELKESDTEVERNEPVVEKEQDAVMEKNTRAGDDSTIAFIKNQLEEDARMGNVVPIYYTVPVVGYNGRVVDRVSFDRTEKKSEKGIAGLFSRLCCKKKSRADIVKLLSAGNLSTGQLSMIKIAIENKLTEGQLLGLINNNLEPEKMQEIIEIAVLENSLPD